MIPIPYPFLKIGTDVRLGVKDFAEILIVAPFPLFAVSNRRNLVFVHWLSTTGQRSSSKRLHQVRIITVMVRICRKVSKVKKIGTNLRFLFARSCKFAIR